MSFLNATQQYTPALFHRPWYINIDCLLESCRRESLAFINRSPLGFLEAETCLFRLIISSAGSLSQETATR